ncbi:MAG: OB-fold domain-containing protein [Acidimicrobiales bacterium]|nr:OB-fold domain-containing protein [Acidimicrobiales bacterium]
MTEAAERTSVPAVEGFFTMGDEPQLIGGRLQGGAYCFPLHLGGGDPRQPDGTVEQVLLSRTGQIWSFTNSAYPPPPPFVIAEPYEPIVIAAVELEVERMVVLGQVAPGWAVDDLNVGMAVQMELGVLYTDDDVDYMTWQWRPLEVNPRIGGGPVFDRAPLTESRSTGG